MEVEIIYDRVIYSTNNPGLVELNESFDIIDFIETKQDIKYQIEYMFVC